MCCCFYLYTAREKQDRIWVWPSAVDMILFSFCSPIKIFLMPRKNKKWKQTVVKQRLWQMCYTVETVTSKIFSTWKYLNFLRCWLKLPFRNLLLNNLWWLRIQLYGNCLRKWNIFDWVSDYWGSFKFK